MLMPVWPYSIFLFHQEMRNNELSSSCLDFALSNQLFVSFPPEAHESSTHYHELSTSFLSFFFFPLFLVSYTPEKQSTTLDGSLGFRTMPQLS